MRKFPGIHMRALVREVDESLALVQYHLRGLEEARIVRSVQVGGFHRFFPVEAYKELSSADRAILNVLRRERALEIVLALLEFGRLQHRDLLEVVGGSKPGLTYQLDKLVEAGLVERTAKGDERGFSLRSPEHVRELLSRYEPVADVLARVHDTWDDLFSGHRRKT